jgi:capsular exopolysaccharide synthesis family protein
MANHSLLPRGDSSADALHLRDYWHVLLRRRWLALSVLALVVGAGLARVALVQPQYRATTQLLIERQAPDVLDFDKNPRAQEALDDFYQTQYRLLQSRMLARQVVERLDLLQEPTFGGPRTAAELEAAEKSAPGASPAMEAAIDRFQAHLHVEPIRNSQLVAISYDARRPDLSAQAANALAQAYIQQTLDFRFRISAEAGQWLDRETAEHTRKLAEAEVALQDYQKREGLANMDERRALLDQKLKDLGSTLTAARTRRMEKEALSRQMQGAGNPEELPEVIRSPLVQTLRTELAALERQEADLSQRYLDEHPQVLKVRQQIRDTRAKIAAEARRIVRAAQNVTQAAAAQEASLAGALEAAKREGEDLSRRGLKYDELKRDLEASQRLSESLLQRQKQTDVSRDVKVSNVHVIDAAVPPHAPFRPQPVRDVALSILLGLGCAGAAALLRDYFDQRVAKPSDVRGLGLSLLGVIPETRARDRRLGPAGRPGHEAFAEGYRVLRTALPADDLEGGQVLLVTSTLAGEGKSLTALNLAQALASSDERVLLIDADLRRPALSTLLGTREAPGLADVILHGAGADQAVQHVAGARLSLLPAGSQVSRNAADLLATDAFRKLLGHLRGRFDRIIIDSPPVGAVADALILGPQADGVVVVARSGKVARGALANVLERLRNARAHILGVVLNRARPDRHSYDYGPPFTAGARAAYGRRALRAGSIETHTEGRLQLDVPPW